MINNCYHCQRKKQGHILINLVLATLPPLLLLAPIPVPCQWLCQHEHVCGHTVNQPEEVPGLKITTSLDLRAAPLADDITDGSTDIGKSGHSHWGHVAVGMNCWKSPSLVSGADAGKNVCQTTSNAKESVPGQREGLIFLFARSMLCTYIL